jgi:hypothetical protein
MKTAWMLILIDPEGEITHVTTDDLDAILMPESNGMNEITGGDPEMAEHMIADLSRVGARYAEFIGGTVVLAAVEQ